MFNRIDINNVPVFVFIQHITDYVYLLTRMQKFGRNENRRKYKISKMLLPKDIDDAADYSRNVGEKV